MSDPRLPTLEGEELEPFFTACRAGATYRAALEQLLVELPLERAELLMQRLREGRAAFVTLTDGASGRALLVGDALSGSALALGRAGFELTVIDSDPRRLALARERDRSIGGGRVRFVRADPRAPLPFATESFAVAVDERGAPTRGELAELARVTREELLVVADNRLAYKLSSGVRADFRVVGPLGLLRRAAQPPHGERSLRGWRRCLTDVGLSWTEGYALYPHRFDFSHVVALDGPLPTLTVGPKERANKLKLAARSAGLFPLFTPSFALRAGRGPRPGRWIDGALRRVSTDLRTSAPTVEHLIATRGNTCVFLTDGPRWCVHLPLSPAQERQSRRHFEALRLLEDEHPSFPSPRALWSGEIDGRYLCVERRLDGLSAAQLTGDLPATARTYRELALALALLVTRGPGTLDEDDLARTVDRRLAVTAPRAACSGTGRALEEIAERLRERLAAWQLPLVLHHSDLRAKHVQVASDGSLIGLMDFGS
ncbi:MAG: phosphotransferase, partial [Planctomycetota bacterium]